MWKCANLPAGRQVCKCRDAVLWNADFDDCYDKEDRLLVLEALLALREKTPFLLFLLASLSISATTHCAIAKLANTYSL